MHVEELNDTNCKTYLLVSGTDAAIVDPVRERYETYKMVLAARGLTLRMVLETHMHADHLMLNRACKEGLGAPVVMHDKSPSPIVDRHVKDGDVLTLGKDTIRVLHTPGHTPDSVSFVLDGDGTSAASPQRGRHLAVLTGDTLLIGGSGRCDFPGGDAGAQYDAVTKTLFLLPEETIVWPAHDYKGNRSSTIGAEKRTNPRFLNKSRDEYVALMANLNLPLPDKIQQALQVNQSGFEPNEVSFPQVSDVAALPALSPADVFRKLREPSPPLVLDVREPEEFTGELGHIGGSILVPLDLLEHRLPKLTHAYGDREVVVVCRAGARSASAGAILRRAGFQHVVNLDGGMLGWTAAKLPVQR